MNFACYALFIFIILDPSKQRLLFIKKTFWSETFLLGITSTTTSNLFFIALSCWFFPEQKSDKVVWSGKVVENHHAFLASMVGMFVYKISTFRSKKTRNDDCLLREENWLPPVLLADATRLLIECCITFLKKGRGKISSFRGTIFSFWWRRLDAFLEGMFLFLENWLISSICWMLTINHLTKFNFC